LGAREAGDAGSNKGLRGGEGGQNGRDEGRQRGGRIGSHVPVTVLQVHKKRNFRLS